VDRVVCWECGVFVEKCSGFYIMVVGKKDVIRNYGVKTIYGFG